MHWHNRLDILRWRSLEETDAGGELLSGDRRREGTARTRSGLTADILSQVSQAELDAFLIRRSAWLRREALIPGAEMSTIVGDMAAPQGRWAWALTGWGVVLAVGFALTGIGQEREINLLALPLVGLLLWNSAIIVLSLAVECAPSKVSAQRRPGLLVQWAASKWRHRAEGASAQGRSPVAVSAQRLFRERIWLLASERLKSTTRAWLHVAAALLAIGSGLGMYAKGWSREYRAVWESTLLGPRQAESFFGTLFGPASAVFGLPLPVREIEAMQRTGGESVRSGDALPWINLYAGTLVLFVVVPRVLLAGLTRIRSNGRVEGLWRALEWEPYAKRLLRAVEGGDEVVLALLHGIRGNNADKDRWIRAIQDALGGGLRVDFQTVTSGDEDEFVTRWEPRARLVAVVFQFATTPEEEVHRRLAADLQTSLRRRFADGKLLVLLDASTVRGRWGADHVRSRRELWHKLLEGLVDQIEFADGTGDANHLPDAMSKAV